MSKKRYYISLICLLMLCTTIYGVEIVTTTHNFSAMNGDKAQIEFSDKNAIAKTPLLTYKCAPGAKFDADPNKTHGNISIFMEGSGVAVTTTQIDNLKEIDIYHYPQENLSSEIVVSISTDGENWEELQLINQVSVYVRATMPATGDYYLQIKRKSKDFYIHQIEYTTEKCACFPYIKPE